MSDKVTTGGVSPRADKIFKIIITVLALVMCFIQIGKYISIGGKPIVNMYYLRIYALHYMFGMLFAFLMYDWKAAGPGSRRNGRISFSPPLPLLWRSMS